MITSFSWRHKKYFFVILEHAFAVRKTSHARAGVTFFHFPYINCDGSAIGIKFAFKRFDMVIIPLCFEISEIVNPRYTFFELQVVAAQFYITLSFLQLVLRGQSVLTLQLHLRVSCVSFWTFFLLCALIICDTFWVQL